MSISSRDCFREHHILQNITPPLLISGWQTLALITRDTIPYFCLTDILKDELLLGLPNLPLSSRLSTDALLHLRTKNRKESTHY